MTLSQSSHAAGDAESRARSLGILFDGFAGRHNAITDVGGLKVGYVTLIEDETCRTGLTAILPRGETDLSPSRAAMHSFNGNGEMTGAHWVREVGHFTGPVVITNTNGVGAAHEGVQRWLTSRADADDGSRWFLPVVAETYDGYLNDIDAFAIRPHHVEQAIAAATGGAIAEGNVGGGTGMICYGFKGGSGTSSRLVAERPWTVGAFVQANFGRQQELHVRGMPLGRYLAGVPGPERPGGGAGSIIVVVATDAPLSAVQLGGIARRATMGMARTGSCGHHSSGDIFLALSTAQFDDQAFVPDADLSSFFEATANAVEEAILNALVAARTMTGFQGRVVEAIDHKLMTDQAAAFLAMSDAMPKMRK